MSILKNLIPIFTTIIAVMLINLPTLNNSFYLDFAIPLIYFWIIVNPNSFWFVYLFLLGLFSDTLSNVTLGIHSLSYLMIWVLVIYFYYQRVMDTLLGINIVSFIVITISYFIYGIFAYINNTLQLYDLLFGALIIFVISMLLNMLLVLKK
ncbi:MAG: hypothetical protein P8N25_03485 [Alphaproteobacteria bacterium]|nr:hypothetical protein [Alphaproteobacteria bacterium]